MCADCDICVQWARRNPQDWEDVPASEWAALPDRGVPSGLGDTPGGRDNMPGWIQAICVQGLAFENYDHYAVEFDDDSVIVTQWTDDPDDFPEEEFAAQRWVLKHLAPDEKVDGRYNTVQTVEYWCGSAVRNKFLDEGRLAQNTLAVNPWSEFILPAEAVIRHGVWLPGNSAVGSLYAQHQIVRRALRWDNWLEGVPADRVKAGRAV